MSQYMDDVLAVPGSNILSSFTPVEKALPTDLT